MAAAAKRARKVFQMGMVWRFKADSQVAKDYIDKGRLGDIYHIRVNLLRRRGVPGLGGWFTTKAKSGGGGMIDIGVHFFDLVMWLTDHWKPTTVSAQTYSKFGSRMKDYVYVRMWAEPPEIKGTCDVDDYAAGFVRFGKKCSMSFEISWAGNVQGGNFVEILGEKAGIRMADGNPLRIFTEDNGHVADITPQYPDNNGMEAEARNFVNACLGREKPLATGDQGVAVMKLIDAIYQSSKTGKDV